MTVTQPVHVSLEQRVEEVTERLRQLEPELAVTGDLPRSVAGMLSERGLTALCLPERLRGEGQSITGLAETVRALARADAATAWCLFIMATAPWLLAYASDECVAEVYSDPQARIGGALAPTGTAVETDGGYRLSGRWAFGSGVSACHYVVANARCPHDNSTVFLVLPQADISTRDVWDGMGLARSGSGAFSVTDVFVPQHRAIRTTAAVRWPEAPFRIPFRATFVAGAAVLCGIAEEMLARVMALCIEKKPTFGRRLIAEEPRIQFLVADCRGDLEAAYAGLYQAASRIEFAAERGGVGLEDQIAVRIAIHHARKAALAVVDRLHLVAGSQGIPHDGVFARLLRDVHTASQHYMFSDEVAEVAGAAMLGFVPDGSRL